MQHEIIIKMFKIPSAVNNTSIKMSRQKFVIGIKFVREKLEIFIHNFMACTHGKSNFLRHMPQSWWIVFHGFFNIFYDFIGTQCWSSSTFFVVNTTCFTKYSHSVSNNVVKISNNKIKVWKFLLQFLSKSTTVIMPFAFNGNSISEVGLNHECFMFHGENHFVLLFSKNSKVWRFKHQRGWR
mgnify:CR=1 FL=1